MTLQEDQYHRDMNLEEGNDMPGEGKKNRFLLLYATQTGQAESIAEEIEDKCDQYGLCPEKFNLGQTEKKFNIEREACIVFVTSTTGDGDPPDMAQKFFRRLKKKTLPDDYLSHLNYTLLGLGDSNYTNFCNAGKTLNRRLEELGAKTFYTPGWADDATGLEVVVEPWMEGLFPALCQHLGLPAVASPNSESSLADMCSESNTDIHTNVLDTGDLSQTNKNSVTDDRGCQTNISVSDRDISGTDNGERSQTNKNSVTDDPEHQTDIPVSDRDISGTAKSADNDNLKQDKNTNSVINRDTMEANVIKVVESLRTSVPPLCGESLSIPLASPAYLKIEHSPDKPEDLESVALQNNAHFASAAAPVSMATVSSCTVMTREDAVKKTLCLRMNIKDNMFDYLPGDSVSVICQNNEKEVDRLLERLGVIAQADQLCILTVSQDTKKRNASVPAHYPHNCSLRHLFLTCVDIRVAPKKALLRILVDYTLDDAEKRRLQELCSKQGTTSYSKYVREVGVGILDVLLTFPSCQPPVERLLEHLPKLQPRPYSVCSSPLSEPGIIEVVFNIVEIPEGEGRCFCRRGIATGMLDALTLPVQQTYSEDSLTVSAITDSLAGLNVSPIKLQVFPRTNQHFHMPDDLSVPIIMIGPGTGVAPFVGYLRHREALRSRMSDTEKYGETWLFYGCRHRDKDYLYRYELARFEKIGILSRLCVCYSREEQAAESPRYVQHNIREHAAELVPLIDEKDGMIFVCGDAKHMAKEVSEVIAESIHKVKGCGLDVAKQQVMTMRLHRSYLEDVWT